MITNGIRHLTTAPYHAASNGLAERPVQTVKQGLLKQTQGDVIGKLSQFIFNVWPDVWPTTTDEA